VPIDGHVATLTVTGLDDVSMEMPIYGRYEMYLDDDLRLAVPITPNMEYQQDWLQSFAAQHGDALRLHLQYGSLQADYKARLLAR
jgi:hypothetical protein